MMRGRLADDGEFDQAIRAMLEAVDTDLLAKAEVAKARLNGKIRYGHTIPISWIRATAEAIAADLDELQYASNPVDQDREHRWEEAAEQLSHALCEGFEVALYHEIGSVATCMCCLSVYTAPAFLRLAFVGRDDAARIEKRNCGCREGGATIAADIKDLGRREGVMP